MFTTFEERDPREQFFELLSNMDMEICFKSSIERKINQYISIFKLKMSSNYYRKCGDTRFQRTAACENTLHLDEGISMRIIITYFTFCQPKYVGMCHCFN